MTTSTIIAIALLFVAITDTILAKLLLPNILAKSMNTTPEQRQQLLKIVNGMTFVFAGGGVVVYITQCLG